MGKNWVRTMGKKQNSTRINGELAKQMSKQVLIRYTHYLSSKINGKDPLYNNIAADQTTAAYYALFVDVLAQWLGSPTAVPLSSASEAVVIDLVEALRPIQEETPHAWRNPKFSELVFQISKLAMKQSIDRS